MKKIIIGLVALTSISAFAAPYNCTFTLVEGIDQENPSLQDSAKLNPEFLGSDENRLKVAKKSVKVELSDLNQANFKGQMAATLWIDETTAVGPQQNEGYIAATVSRTAKVFQVSSTIKGTFYNLVCRKP
jgi:hypothetical protein